MLANYESMRTQKTRLGSYERPRGCLRGIGSGFGSAQSDEAGAIIGQIGNIVGNIMGMLEGHETRRTEIKAQTQQVTVQLREGTKRLDISTTGQVSMAKTGVEMVKAKYGAMTKLIIGIGGIAAVLMITGAGGFAVVRTFGDK